MRACIRLLNSRSRLELCVLPCLESESILWLQYFFIKPFYHNYLASWLSSSINQPTTYTFLHVECLGLTNDFFVRTTSDQHKAAVTALWRRLEANGQIYLASYEGWCVKFLPCCTSTASFLLVLRPIVTSRLDCFNALVTSAFDFF